MLSCQGHFDAANITARQEKAAARYKALKEPIQKRSEQLVELRRLYQFLRDLDDEDDWIREKEPIAGSTNRGREFIGLQNLIQKHETLMLEIDGHQDRIKDVCEKGCSFHQ